MKSGTIITIASLSALIAVAIGAFGAHGASGEQAKAWIVTGSSQHMAHSLALFACAFIMSQGGKEAAKAIAFFIVGIALFAGSLYALALGAPKIVTVAAPFGGLSFIIGWGMLAWAGIKLNRKTP
jgi:uncharacterized membrane protein YgdD (TMEM256/DUF423 family)